MNILKSIHFKIFLILFLINASQLVISHPKGFKSADHVLILGLDGFGEKYMYNYTENLINIKSLIQSGSKTIEMRDRNPTLSAPNWSSLLCSQEPEKSGIIDNDWQIKDSDPQSLISKSLSPISGKGKIPQTLFQVAKDQNPNITVALSISWDWIHLFSSIDSVDFLFRGKENDEDVAKAMAVFIRNYKPNIMFVHFDQIDETGHKSYWGSEKYYQAAKKTDDNIGIIIQALKESKIYDKTLIMVTADHGGYGNTHGMFMGACIYIPGIFSGPCIKQNQSIENSTSILDLAPTALNALGLNKGKYMSGQILEELYLEKPLFIQKKIKFNKRSHYDNSSK